MGDVFPKPPIPAALSARDSGTEDAPVVYRAHEGETVRRWPEFADQAGVGEATAAKVQARMRTGM